MGSDVFQILGRGADVCCAFGMPRMEWPSRKGLPSELRKGNGHACVWKAIKRCGLVLRVCGVS